MAEQNVYDNAEFFHNYCALRGKSDNYNDLLEQPALWSLLPPLAGRRVLDLGCGFGDACARYADAGAAAVVGIDLSEKMIARARRDHMRPQVTYLCRSMANLEGLAGPFDVVTSSLAVHYVADFPALARAVAGLLTPGGCFVFSQEHPLTTAPVADIAWQKDAAGQATAYLLSDYGRPGFRTEAWLGQRVEKYHRRFSDLVQALCAADLSITAMEEPVPDAETLAHCPRMEREFHKPSFLLIRAEKRDS